MEDEMLCPQCAQEQVSTEIPPTQALCPRCYRSHLPAPRPGNGGRATKKVLVFIADDMARNRWEQDIQNYLQPDEVGWSFVVGTAEEFRQVTSGSAIWHVLVSDRQVVEQHQGLLQAFAERQPRAVIVALYGPDTGTLPSTPPVAGAVMLQTPADTDDWLLMMHQVLSQVS